MEMIPETDWLPMLRAGADWAYLIRAIETQDDKVEANRQLIEWIEAHTVVDRIRALFGLAVIVTHLVDEADLKAFMLVAEIEFPLEVE